MSVNTILNLIRSDNYITVNKSLIKSIGVLPATMYVELCSRYNYFQTLGLLKDGYFYCTVETFKNEVGLSRDEQETAIKKLVKLGLIDKKNAKLKGDETQKRYFKIVDNMDLILSFFQDKVIKTQETIATVGNEGIPHFEYQESHISTRGISTTSNINNNTNYNSNQSVSQSDIPSPHIERQTTDDRQTDKIPINIENEIQTIFTNAQVDLYSTKLFIESVIRKLYTDGTMPVVLKMGLTQQDIRDRLQLLTNRAIDTALIKLKGVKSNKEIYFAKCLLTAVVEVDLDDYIQEIQDE